MTTLWVHPGQAWTARGRHYYPMVWLDLITVYMT